jgi:DNA polymerase
VKQTKNKLVLDYETRSCANLKKIGAYEYARHPSTEITFASYKLNDEPTKRWRPLMGEPPPKDLIEHLSNDDTIIVAHNAGFEILITRFVLVKYL